MLPYLDQKYVGKSIKRKKKKARGARYQSAGKFKSKSTRINNKKPENQREYPKSKYEKRLYDFSDVLGSGKAYSNRYSPNIFNGESYLTRPFKYSKIKKVSTLSKSHKTKVLPVMVNLGEFLIEWERKIFQPPKKIGHVKPGPPMQIEYEPRTGVRAGQNTPIGKKRPPTPQPIIEEVKPLTPPAEIRGPSKDLWRKLRIFVKFWGFPRWWYKREYRIITNLRQIIARYETEHWKPVMEDFRKRGLSLAPQSLKSIWYDTSNFNIIFNKQILDSYLLDQEASDEAVFVEGTQDRSDNIQVLFY